MSGKRYSINYEDGVMVSVAIDGREYTSIDQVPDEDDRTELELLIGPSFDSDKLQAEVEASSARMTRTLTWLFGAIGVASLLFAAYAAGRGALSGAGGESGWWILGLVLGLLGVGFTLATVLIWKVFGAGSKPA